MPIITGPSIGETTNLDVTLEARHRILIGLSWHAKPFKKADVIRRALIEELHFSLLKRNIVFKDDEPNERESDYDGIDLDLSCFAFDKEGNLKTIVDPSAWNAIDQSGKIYHSGDDMEGLYDHDDEQIHIELKDLPDEYEHFFFVVQSDSMYLFSDVDTPIVRLADSMSNKDFLSVKLDEICDKQSHAYVFCQISRKDNGWVFKNISEMTDFNQDWSDFLKQYL